VQHVRESSSTARLHDRNIRAKPAAVNGVPRSEVNTNGDLGDRPDCRKLPPPDLDFLDYSCAGAMNRRFEPLVGPRFDCAKTVSVDVGQGSIWFQCDAFALVDPFGNFGSVAMATQIVMDHTGHTRHYFNPNDAQALASAEKRFMELTGLGFTAAVRKGPNEIIKVRSFDLTAEETLFFPRLIGG
jgi:hypothetical protein